MSTFGRTLTIVMAMACLPLGARAQAGEAGQLGSGTEPDSVISLTLDEALIQAIRGSRDLEEARLGLAEAEGQVSEAWASVYPSIDFSSSYTRNLTPSISFIPAIFFNPNAEPGELLKVQFGAENVWSGTISLEQPLFRASAFIGVGAAGRFRSLQEETVRGAQQDVITQVRLQYYELLLAEEQAGLIQRSLERVAESLDETRAMNRAGLSSDYDVLRLEVELANLQPDLRRAENEARRMERELGTALGLPPGTDVDVVGSLAEINLDEPAGNTAENARLLDLMGVSLPDDMGEAEMDGLLQQARATNSQLEQAELNAELSNTQLQVERSELLPEISLFATYDVQAQQDGKPKFFGNSSQRGYGRNVGLRVTLPLFSGFSRGARIDQRQAAVRSARVQLEQAEEEVGNQLQTLVERTQEARLRASGQRLAVEQARRGFEIASAQYREGLGSQLELTDAEVALRESEYNYAEAVYEYLSNRARIDQVVGQVPLPGGA